VAVFPDTIEKVIGVDYGSFKEAWGVSRLKFEAYTLGTLGVIVLVAVIGYVAGAPTRRKSAAVPI
jgi:glutamate:GABA antiporter